MLEEIPSTVSRIVTLELGHLLSAAFKIASSTAWDQVGLYRKLLGPGLLRLLTFSSQFLDTWQRPKHLRTYEDLQMQCNML